MRFRLVVAVVLCVLAAAGLLSNARTQRLSSRQATPPTSARPSEARGTNIPSVSTATDTTMTSEPVVPDVMSQDSGPPEVVRETPDESNRTIPPPVIQLPTQWPTSLQPCGGDLPPCSVKNAESRGDYSARNASSGACGAWQFIPSTWAGFGGYTSACDAPPDVQDAKARLLWAGGAGCSHWSAC